jgi:2-dehydropantoate 2-reductase
MRIATLATGGIGGFLAVRLTQAGHEVACIARGPHLAAIRTGGLRLEKDGQVETVHPWKATDAPAEVGPVDAVIFGVKGGGLESAARAVVPMLSADTIVVPFLNGVEASDRLAAILPAQNVANGVAYVSTTIAEPGLIRQVGDFQRFLFGERDNRDSPRLAALRQAIRAGGADAPDVADIDVEVWTKFVLFSALSGITAAGRCTLGTIRDTPDLAALFRTVMAETEVLAKARGVALPPDLAATHWERIQSQPEGMRASTAIDLEKGAPLETPWINGAVVRLAAEAGIAVPANAALAAVLAPWVDGRR